MSAQGSAALRPLPRASSSWSLESVRNDPLAFMTAEIAITGDVFEYELGGYHAVFLGRPAHVKHVLQTNAQNYVKAGTPDLLMLAPMLGRGLMTSEGEAWSEQRRTVQPAFHRERIESLVTMIRCAAEEMCDGWTGAIDVESEMSRLTLRIIARALFGYDLADASTDFAGAVAAMNEFMAHFDPADHTRMVAFRQAHATVGRMTQAILEQRRMSGESGDDMLSMLIDARRGDGAAFSDAEICDQIFTFLMAGHETTAKSLTWALYLVDQNPQFRAWLREEARGVLPTNVDKVVAVERLERTWMLMQEAMRLYPPAWLMSRIAAEDDVIDEYLIRQGKLVVVSPYIVHRDARYWEDPERFDPQRFAPGRAPLVTDYSYFPFGGGPRTCIGRRLAMVETVVVMAVIASRVDLHLAPGHRVVPEALVTLRPRHGMPMQVRRTP